MQSSSRDRIHNAVVDTPGITTQEVAKRFGLDASTASRYLNELVRDGRLEKDRAGKEIHFRPTPRIQVRCVTPATIDRKKGSDRWTVIEWDTASDVDWRYPLVSRIQDDLARRTLVALLDRCLHEGLFTPWLLFRDALDEWIDRQVDASKQDEVHRFLRRRDIWQSYTFVVFGSCARGDMGRDSDVDLLVVGPSQELWHGWTRTLGVDLPFLDLKDPIRRWVAELNLATPRVIDIFYAEESEVVDLPSVLLDEIRATGLTVYSTEPRKFVMETWRPNEGE